jgi:hypothetical protein
MSGTAYKALGFLVWRGGIWYLRRRFGMAKWIGAGTLAALAAIGGVVAAAARRRRQA